MCVSICMYVGVCMYMYVRMYVCEYVGMYGGVANGVFTCTCLIKKVM